MAKELSEDHKTSVIALHNGENMTPLLTFIKESVASNHCFQSRCRMAPLEQGGVVDSMGHVYCIIAASILSGSSKFFRGSYSLTPASS
jgi:hypothetical protein